MVTPPALYQGPNGSKDVSSIYTMKRNGFKNMSPASEIRNTQKLLKGVCVDCPFSARLGSTAGEGEEGID